jgi:hypothetical protein
MMFEPPSIAGSLIVGSESRVAGQILFYLQRPPCDKENRARTQVDRLPRDVARQIRIARALYQLSTAPGDKNSRFQISQLTGFEDVV